MQHILIIEDDEAIAAIGRDYLELEGYAVEIVPDGGSGLERGLEGAFDLILLVGALFSLTTAMVNTGAIDWIMQVTLGGFGSWNAVLFYIVMSVVLVLIRGALPGGPLLVAMVTPSVIAMGAAFDMSTMLLVVTLSIWGQLSALVPFVDGQWLMTYNYGYFNTRDLLKVGVPWSVAFVLIMALALPPLGEFAHLFAV